MLITAVLLILAGPAALKASGLWCPTVSSGVMEVVVATLEETEVLNSAGNKEKMYVTTSLVWKGGQLGNPSYAMSKVFH